MLKKWSLPLILSFNCLVSGELLLLSDAEQKAKVCSYEIRTEYINELVKEWEKRNAIASYCPSVSYNGVFNRSDKRSIENNRMMSFFIQGAPGSLLDLQTTIDHSVTITQPVSNGGAEFFAIKIAKETKKAIDLQIKDSELEVIYNTRKAYFDCIIAFEQETAAREDLSWTVQNLEKAKIRHQGGDIPFTDVLQWESEFALKNNNLAVAIASRKTMMLNLFNSQGIDVEKMDTSVQLQPYEVFEKWYARGCAALTEKVDSNFQLRAIKHYTVVSAEMKKIATSKFLPSLNASLTASWPQDEKFVPDRKPGWTAGFVLTVPLFTGFRNTTNYKKVKYEYGKTVIDQQKLENQIKINCERIRMFYKAAYEGVEASRIQRELMDKQLQLMQQRYDGGLVNQSQLLEVALGARMARVGYIQKLFECLLLESEFLKTTGKLEVAP